MEQSEELACNEPVAGHLNRAAAIATQLTHAINDFVRRAGIDVPEESITEDPMSS